MKIETKIDSQTIVWFLFGLSAVWYLIGSGKGMLYTQRMFPDLPLKRMFPGIPMY